MKEYEKLIVPTDNTLSLEAKGVLATMLNDPCCDYCLITDLQNNLRTDEKSMLEKALIELCEKNYVIKLPSSTFAVNKVKIHDMYVFGR